MCPPRWKLGNMLTTCYHKNAVRKSKLWPWNSQTEWNHPRRWKRINEIWKENWNVYTLQRAGAINELVKQTDKYRIDICALQEIRWIGKGTVKKKLFYIVGIKMTNNLTQDFILVDIL